MWIKTSLHLYSSFSYSTYKSDFASLLQFNKNIALYLSYYLPSILSLWLFGYLSFNLSDIIGLLKPLQIITHKNSHKEILGGTFHSETLQYSRALYKQYSEVLLFTHHPGLKSKRLFFSLLMVFSNAVILQE